MDRNGGAGTYRLVVRGELGDRWAGHFEGMRLTWEDGNSVFTGEVVDQAHLVGLIQQAQELSLELVSVEQVARASQGGT